MESDLGRAFGVFGEPFVGLLDPFRSEATGIRGLSRRQDAWRSRWLGAAWVQIIEHPQVLPRALRHARGCLVRDGAFLHTPRLIMAKRSNPNKGHSVIFHAHA